MLSSNYCNCSVFSYSQGDYIRVLANALARGVMDALEGLYVVRNDSDSVGGGALEELYVVRDDSDSVGGGALEELYVVRNDSDSVGGGALEELWLECNDSDSVVDKLHAYKVLQRVYGNDKKIGQALWATQIDPKTGKLREDANKGILQAAFKLANSTSDENIQYSTVGKSMGKLVVNFFENRPGSAEELYTATTTSTSVIDKLHGYNAMREKWGNDHNIGVALLYTQMDKKTMRLKKDAKESIVRAAYRLMDGDLSVFGPNGEGIVQDLINMGIDVDGCSVVNRMMKME